jgi:hypothetical protein
MAFSAVQAQEKVPTKKETFNFIVELLPNVYISDWDIGETKITDKNENSFTIEFQSGSREKSDFISTSFSLENVSKVTLNRNGALILRFKSTISVYSIIRVGRGKTDNWDQLYLNSDDQKSIKRLYKAFNHFIDISGNKVDKTLFDN